MSSSPPTNSMSTSTTQLNKDLQIKIADYQSTLEFIQNELIQDRGKLAKAKQDNEPEEVICLIQEDIDKLEKGIDRYQSWLTLLNNQLKSNESTIHQSQG